MPGWTSPTKRASETHLPFSCMASCNGHHLPSRWILRGPTSAKCRLPIEMLDLSDSAWIHFQRGHPEGLTRSLDDCVRNWLMAGARGGEQNAGGPAPSFKCRGRIGLSPWGEGVLTLACFLPTNEASPQLFQPAAEVDSLDSSPVRPVHPVRCRRSDLRIDLDSLSRPVRRP